MNQQGKGPRHGRGTDRWPLGGGFCAGGGGVVVVVVQVQVQAAAAAQFFPVQPLAAARKLAVAATMPAGHVV